MYTREFPVDEVIAEAGKKFREIFFITSGNIDMEDANRQVFMKLKDRNIFGDYQLLFDLTSNISYRVARRDDQDPEDMNL